MAPTVRRATNVALVAIALVLAWSATQQWRSQLESRPPGLSPGTKFPSLALIGLSGDTVDVDFSADTGDRLVVFYSIDCEYCQQSLPVYKTVSEMCGLSLTLALTDISEATLATWWEANGNGFSERCSSLSVGRLLAPPSRYDVRGTPTHYLLGSDGRVKYHGEGMLLEVPQWLDP